MAHISQFAGGRDSVYLDQWVDQTQDHFLEVVQRRERWCYGCQGMAKNFHPFAIWAMWRVLPELHRICVNLLVVSEKRIHGEVTTPKHTCGW